MSVIYKYLNTINRIYYFLLLIYTVGEYAVTLQKDTTIKLHTLIPAVSRFVSFIFLLCLTFVLSASKLKLRQEKPLWKCNLILKKLVFKLRIKVWLYTFYIWKDDPYRNIWNKHFLSDSFTKYDYSACL